MSSATLKTWTGPANYRENHQARETLTKAFTHGRYYTSGGLHRRGLEGTWTIVFIFSKKSGSSCNWKFYANLRVMFLPGFLSAGTGRWPIKIRSSNGETIMARTARTSIATGTTTRAASAIPTASFGWATRTSTCWPTPKIIRCASNSRILKATRGTRASQ